MDASEYREIKEALMQGCILLMKDGTEYFLDCFLRVEGSEGTDFASISEFLDHIEYEDIEDVEHPGD